MPDEAAIERREVTVTIANGGHTSDAEDMVGYLLVGLSMPAAWTAADIAFEVGDGDGTYRDAYDFDGNIIAATVAANRYIAFGDMAFQGVRRVKVKSVTTADNTVEQAQGAERIIRLHMRRGA